MRSWPAEWAPHIGCILLYPHNPGTFRVELARKQVRYLVQSVSQIGQEHVYLFCHNDTTADIVRRQFLLDNDASRDVGGGGQEQERRRRVGKIHVLVCPSNDTWARDTAPTFVIDDENNINKKKLLGLDWDFNAYGGETGGGCYWPCTQDQAVAKHICQSLPQQEEFNKLPMIAHVKVPLVLEGGSIHTDGEGTILTTKECLLHPNRNPKLSQYEVEQYLLESTGCSKVIWLEHGLAYDDDTNGHIDNFVCFVAPTKLVLAWTDDEENDPDNYRRCRAAQKLLESSTDAQGRALHITKLHLPKPMYYTQSDLDSLQFGKYDDNTHVFPRTVGERMAASYVNFYISNGAVLVPQFGGDAESADSNALATLRSVFSSSVDETDDTTTTTQQQHRTVVGIPSREILLGGGNIHCITQQIPSL